MKIQKKYNPKLIEDKWYQIWLEKKLFTSKPDKREAFTVVIPPPNVTGVLHMGHMLNNTIQDILVRKARMQGFNTCWVPGTDHASIATEAKVSQKLQEDGIDKKSLSREEFLKHAWEWTNKHGGIILEQLKKLGASCDWDRTKFTMDDDMSEAVFTTFVDLYNKGYIYRGIRMINWDPEAQTALSDEEVIHKELNGKLYYIKYKIKDTDQYLTVATTRPETILGDTAICVHPNDKRYKSLKNKQAIVPLINREVPIIFDNYIDMEFGSGALKVTPAHDINDYQLGQKHKLEVIDTIDDGGKMSKAAQIFVGEDRFIVRNKIIKKLEEINQLEKTEELTHNVGFSERTDAIIEPKLSMQWFCKTKKLAKPALDNVMNNNIKFHPENIKKTYKHWMENIKDWCISRQLWWGHRIPVWYCKNENSPKQKCKEPIISKDTIAECPYCKSENIKQDEDVLDTWFSSWLWPISVFDGIKNPKNNEINYYYPTNDLVTAPEILFFWVARMIIAGYEYRKDLPFKNVYFTGIVRDQKRRKMSKSLGNSPDPIKLINQYGADGVRVGILLSSPAGNDLLFNESLCEQGRNFSNKIWNSFRLISSWSVENKNQEKYAEIAVNWFEAKFYSVLAELNTSYSKYKISEALMTTYRLFWDDFCSWYLEIIKPEFGKSIDQKTYTASIVFLNKLLKILHPFMPFITEEIWHLSEKKEEYLTISAWTKEKKFNQKIIDEFETTTELVTAIRNVRKEKNIANKTPITLNINKRSIPNKYDTIITKLCNINSCSIVKEKPLNAFSLRIKTGEYYIPLNDNINITDEINKLKKELTYTKGFLESVTKKLNNKNFVNNAPKKVIELERKKQSDANEKLRLIKEELSSLS